MTRFVNGEEAEVTQKQHKSPCDDCPFSRNSLNGWLGATTAEEWIQLAHGEGSADCHALISPDDEPWVCAGLAIYRANVCKSVRDATVLRLPADRVKVFSSSKEFLAHHKMEVKYE